MTSFIAVLFLIPLANSALWKECNSAIDDTTETTDGKTYYCCNNNGALNWFPNAQSSATNDFCVPFNIIATHSVGGEEINPRVGESVTFMFEIGAADDETGINNIALELDEDGFGFVSQGTCLLANRVCLTKSYSTAGQVIRYRVVATDNSIGLSNGACGPSGCQKYSDIKSFTVQPPIATGCPTVNIQSITPSPNQNWLKTGSYTFNVEDTASSGTSLAECTWTYKNDATLSGRIPRTCNNQFTLSAGTQCTVDGTNKCEVTAYTKDNLNCESKDVKTYNFDSANPTVGTITSSISSPCVNQGTFIQSSATDQTSGISNCDMYDNSVNQGSVLSSCAAGTTCPISKNYAFTTSGSHIVDIRCNDIPSNIGSNTATINVLPSTDPSCSGFPPPPPPTVTLSLSAVPTSVQADDIATSTITATTSDVKSGVVVSFLSDRGLVDTFSSSSCNTGANGGCSITIRSSTTGTATITGTSPGYTSGNTPVTFISPAVCTYGIVLTSTNFDSATKQGRVSGPGNTWELTLTDVSTAACESTISYRIPSVTLTGACDPSTGVYTSPSNPPSGTKVTYPYNFNAVRGGTLPSFLKIYVKPQENPCTLSFDIQDKNNIKVDPSFTVDPQGQSPYVSFFSFSGELSKFDANWEAFYPTLTSRDMKAKCALNCNPSTQNCAGALGQSCEPYDQSLGTNQLKKGSCSVSNPYYNFAQTNKIICLFYDPNDLSLNAVVNHDFIPLDFDIRSTSRISSSVGSVIDLRVDVNNKGLLGDAYTVTLAASDPTAVDITPQSRNTGKIPSKQLGSVTSSIRPLVDKTNLITVTVTSDTQPSMSKVFQVELNPSLFVLPEFGLVGFLQIVIIAAIVYFLLVNKMFKSKPRRRKGKK